MKIEGNPILNSEFINELQSYLSGNVGSDGKNVTVRKMVKLVILVVRLITFAWALAVRILSFANTVKAMIRNVPVPGP